MQRLQPGDLLVSSQAVGVDETLYGVMVYNEHVIHMASDGLTKVKISLVDSSDGTPSFGLNTTWKSIGSYGQQAADRAEDAFCKRRPHWIFDANTCNSEHFARAMTERWRESTHYDKGYSADWNSPSENLVEVQLGEVPHGWTVDIYTYAASDSLQLISYMHEWLHSGVKHVSAGQEPKDDFCIVLCGGTSVSDCRWRCLTGDHMCKAGDILVVSYDGKWQVDHRREGASLDVRRGVPQESGEDALQPLAQEDDSQAVEKVFASGADFIKSPATPKDEQAAVRFRF